MSKYLKNLHVINALKHVKTLNCIPCDLLHELGRTEDVAPLGTDLCRPCFSYVTKPKKLVT